MTLLFFSSTGNSLYLAKRIGGELKSIPVCMKNEEYDFTDSEVGIIFPIYGLCIPPFIENFIKKINVEADYFFALATYGFFPGAVCGQLSVLHTKNGRGFDYINRIRMAENCITFSDMAKQEGDSAKQQKAIDKLLSDIASGKSFVRGDSFFKRMMTANHLKKYEYSTGAGITDKVTVSEECTGCGTCQKVCPMDNIKLSEGKPVFGRNCVSCGGCLQNCPANALHHKEEKSSARYRNPHVELKELIKI